MNETTELLLRLKAVKPGDFVTLSAEEAARCAEIMQRRIPITVEIEPGQQSVEDPPARGRPRANYRVDER